MSYAAGVPVLALRRYVYHSHDPSDSVFFFEKPPEVEAGNAQPYTLRYVYHSHEKPPEVEAGNAQPYTLNPNNNANPEP